MTVKFSKSKWFAYTLLVGLIPVLTSYTLAIIGDKEEGMVNENAILGSSFIIAGISTVVSIVVLHRLAKRGTR